MTADGSVDCSLEPENQELTVAPLNFCETVTALQILSEGKMSLCTTSNFFFLFIIVLFKF